MGRGARLLAPFIGEQRNSIEQLAFAHCDRENEIPGVRTDVQRCALFDWSLATYPAHRNTG